MPIREYNSQVNSIQPSSAPANSFRELGTSQRRDGNVAGNAFGGMVANVGQFAVHREAAVTQDEINKLSTAFALQELNSSNGWDETVAKSDHNDSSFGKSFIESQYAAIDKLVEGATTKDSRAWAEKEAVRLKISLTKSVHADMSTIAGYQAVANTETVMNAKVAFLQGNPEKLDEALDGVPNAIGAAIPIGADPKLRAKAMAEMTLSTKQAYVKSALGAMAVNTPDQFLKDWKAGKYNKYAAAGLIDPGTDFVGLANQSHDANSRAANAQATADAKVARDAVDNAITKVYSSLYNEDGSVNHEAVAKAHIAFIKELPNMPGFTKTDFSTGQDYINQVEAGANRGNKDDPTVVGEFQKRMMSADRPLTEAEVWRAEQNHLITAETRGAILAEYKIWHPTDKPDPLANSIDRQSFEANLALLTPEKNPATGLIVYPKELQGKPNAYAFMMASEDAYKSWYRQSFQAGLRAGNSAADLLYPGGKAYIDPHKYTGSDPAALLKEADKIVKQAPLVFPTGTTPPKGAVSVPGGSSVPATAIPRNPDGTLRATVPGLPGVR